MRSGLKGVKAVLKKIDGFLCLYFNISVILQIFLSLCFHTSNCKLPLLQQNFQDSNEQKEQIKASPQLVVIARQHYAQCKPRISLNSFTLFDTCRSIPWMQHAMNRTDSCSGCHKQLQHSLSSQRAFYL